MRRSGTHWGAMPKGRQVSRHQAKKEGYDPLDLEDQSYPRPYRGNHGFLCTRQVGERPFLLNEKIVVPVMTVKIGFQGNHKDCRCGNSGQVDDKFCCIVGRKKMVKMLNASSLR